MRVEQQVLGREGARVWRPTRTARGRHGSSGPGPPPACPSPGGPRSVGSKGGFFQAEIGPVDGQSLSGLPSGIQTEPAKKRSPAVTGGRGPHPGCSRRSPAPNGAQRAGPRWRPPSPHALLPEEQVPPSGHWPAPWTSLGLCVLFSLSSGSRLSQPSSAHGHQPALTYPRGHSECDVKQAFV